MRSELQISLTCDQKNHCNCTIPTEPVSGGKLKLSFRAQTLTVSRQNVSVISPRTSFDKRLLKFSGQPSISIDTASLRFTLKLNGQSQTSTDNHEKIDTDEQPHLFDHETLLRGSGTKKNANTLGSTVDEPPAAARRRRRRSDAMVAGGRRRGGGGGTFII